MVFLVLRCCLIVVDLFLCNYFDDLDLFCCMFVLIFMERLFGMVVCYGVVVYLCWVGEL